MGSEGPSLEQQPSRQTSSEMVLLVLVDLKITFPKTIVYIDLNNRMWQLYISLKNRSDTG